MARARTKTHSDDSKKKRHADDDKAKKRTKKAAGVEAAPAEPVPEPEPEEREAQDEESTGADEARGEDGENAAPKPVLTPMGPHAVRDDDIQEAQLRGESAVAEAEAAAGEMQAPAEGENKLQTLKLNDLKRVKIT